MFTVSWNSKQTQTTSDCTSLGGGREEQSKQHELNRKSEGREKHCLILRLNRLDKPLIQGDFQEIGTMLGNNAQSRAEWVSWA